MARFETIKKVTVTEQIMDQIASLITSGELKPGEQLPTERDLAVNLGVTRGRIREALRALSLVGLITIRAGEGSFVSNMEEPIPGDTILWMFHNEIHNLDEVFAARRLIETEIYKTASLSLSDEELIALKQRTQTLQLVAETESTEKFLQRLDEIDLFVGERCGNRIYDKLMQTNVHLRRETSLRLLSVPGAARNGASGRHTIIAAMQIRDAEKLHQALEAFFATSLQFYKSIGN